MRNCGRISPKSWTIDRKCGDVGIRKEAGNIAKGTKSRKKGKKSAPYGPIGDASRNGGGAPPQSESEPVRKAPKRMKMEYKLKDPKERSDENADAKSKSAKKRPDSDADAKNKGARKRPDSDGDAKNKGARKRPDSNGDGAKGRSNSAKDGEISFPDAPPTNLPDASPLRRPSAEIRLPDASARKISVYQPDKPSAAASKPLPPVPLTLDALRLQAPSGKRKGQRRKGRQSFPMEDVQPAPEPVMEPPSKPAPEPINSRRMKQELEKGEEGLARQRDAESVQSEAGEPDVAESVGTEETPERMDLPWLPPPDGAGPVPKGETPSPWRGLYETARDRVQRGAAWLLDRFRQGRQIAATKVHELVGRVRERFPALPQIQKRVRRYRGRLRVPAWRQWRAFGVSSLLMGLAITASVEAVRTGSFMEMCAWAGERIGSFFLSGLLYGTVLALLGAIVGRLWLSGLVVSVVALAASLVNYLKLRIDGTPLVLSDFGLIGQAGDIAGVAGELNPPDAFWRSIWFLTFCVLALFFLHEWTRTKGTDRLAPLVVSLLLTFCLFSAGITAGVGAIFHVDVTERIPPATNHRLYGLTVSLWRELFLQKIAPPRDYGESQMLEVLDEIDGLISQSDAAQESESASESEEGTENAAFNPDVMPNVIVVLSESFFDVNRLTGVSFDRDPVENYHRLQEESISGPFYSHYLGYGTGYIEMSMQMGIGELDLDAGTNICFMPDETYQRFDSLAEQYTNLGNYTAEMLHAYDNSLYNRTVTYPLMGYAESLYSEDIRALGIEWNGNLYGGYYMKDSYFFQAMRQEMEKINATGNRAFLYGITMENHQPFNPDKFNGVSQVKVTAPKLKRSELEILKVGVEGIVRADAALGELTDALREYPVPTIVAFFGDHRPTLPMPNGRTVYTQLGLVPGGDTSLWTTEQIGDIYSSDYLIWANDAALLRGQAGTSKPLGVLSFGPMILELTGQPISRWWRLACLSAQVQIVSREVYFANGDGEVFFTQAEAGLSDDDERLLYLRSCVLYDAIYGERYITREMNRVPSRAGPVQNSSG